MFTKIIKSKVGVLIIGISILILIVVAGLPLNTYRAGWELGTELVAMQNKIPSGAMLETYPPTANLQDDFDQANWGLPDIKATVSDVRELSPPMPYAPLEKDLNKFKYVVEYHEYAFDVQIRTIAGVRINNENPDRNNAPLRTHYWEHETSAPYSWACFWGVGGTSIGKNFDGGVFARFSCLPWGILDYGPVPKNYTFNGYYLGIMNAKIEDSVAGIATEDIGKVDINNKGWVRNIESTGSQLNMYQDDGTYARAYTSISWDMNKVFDPDIKNVVIVYLPFDLMAGSYEYYDVNAYAHNGAITEFKPVDYFLTYTVRMETLIVKEYEARDPATPPNPSPIQKPNDFVPFTAQTFWDKYGFAIIIIAIIGIILLGLAIVIGGPAFFMFLSSMTRTRQCDPRGVKWP